MPSSKTMLSISIPTEHIQTARQIAQATGRTQAAALRAAIALGMPELLGFVNTAKTRTRKEDKQ